MTRPIPLSTNSSAAGCGRGRVGRATPPSGTLLRRPSDQPVQQRLRAAALIRRDSNTVPPEDSLRNVIACAACDVDAALLVLRLTAEEEATMLLPAALPPPALEQALHTILDEFTGRVIPGHLPVCLASGRPRAA